MICFTGIRSNGLIASPTEHLAPIKLTEIYCFCRIAVSLGEMTEGRAKTIAQTKQRSRLTPKWEPREFVRQ